MPPLEAPQIAIVNCDLLDEEPRVNKRNLINHRSTNAENTKKKTPNASRKKLKASADSYFDSRVKNIETLGEGVQTYLMQVRQALDEMHKEKVDASDKRRRSMSRCVDADI
ncbi:hypothetical protein PInf_003758 [Phytophthora infestans]|nr:hypothetical protein PInf_003758 [Phytophthora infestans]